MTAESACEFCDLLMRTPSLSPGEKAYCPRCGGLVTRATHDPIHHTLALSLAAATLLILANAFPFLEISLEGQVRENTIATGVLGLWAGGQEALAMLILFTTILAPALQIASLLYVLLPVALGRVPPGCSGILRFQESLVSWSMLDVYMLALLVTLGKLAQMASLRPETGAFCFVALFLVLALVSSSYDREAIWERLEELR